MNDLHVAPNNLSRDGGVRAGGGEQVSYQYGERKLDVFSGKRSVCPRFLPISLGHLSGVLGDDTENSELSDDFNKKILTDCFGKN